jgi:hypothetical protein
MSKWGLTYKAVEPVFPEEWNTIIDALDDLDKKVVGGLATFVGDGATKTFSIGHGIGAKPVTAMVVKGASGLPDIDYITVDESSINVTFKTPPADGANVAIWWLAVKP